MFSNRKQAMKGPAIKSAEKTKLEFLQKKNQRLDKQGISSNVPFVNTDKCIRKHQLNAHVDCNMNPICE